MVFHGWPLTPENVRGFLTFSFICYTFEKKRQMKTLFIILLCLPLVVAAQTDLEKDNQFLTEKVHSIDKNINEAAGFHMATGIMGATGGITLAFGVARDNKAVRYIGIGQLGLAAVCYVTSSVFLQRAVKATNEGLAIPLNRTKETPITQF